MTTAKISKPQGMLPHYRVELWAYQPFLLNHDHLGRLHQALAEVGNYSFDPEGSFDLEGFDPREASAVPATSGTLRIVDLTSPEDGGPKPEWTVELRVLRLDQATIGDSPDTEASPVEGPLLRAAAEQAVQQSWWFREAGEVVAGCRHRLVLTDHLNTGFDYKRRIESLQRVLSALGSVFPAQALYWQPSAQFLEPRAALESFREDDFRNPLPGGLNVRYYEVEDSTSGEPFRLMDTLGLGALGLTDLEIRFRGLDPEAVSQVLYTTALYLFENGPVLQENETIQGSGERDRWLARRGMALADPYREIWQLDPGSPFDVAAGEVPERN